ncbi:MAG: heavy metal-binding domain-containing protein [Chitinophagaceae bacterium]
MNLNFRTFFFAVIAISFMASCNNNNKLETSKTDSATVKHDDSHAHLYRCPMNCEKGKTYDKEGNCPVCGMKLEHFDGVDNGLTYKMEFASTPAIFGAGKDGVLSFTPKVVGKETESVPLDLQHEKKIHLIVVNNDLSYFEHIHPEYQTDGSYQVKVLEISKAYTNGANHNETRFESGGDYLLFADYLPTGGSHQVEKINFSVKGATKPVVTYNTEKLTGSSDKFSVQLQVKGGHLAPGSQVYIVANVLKEGKEIDANSLENYLGAKAHMVVISLNEKEYLHVHPEVDGGKFQLHATFKKPGIHRGWIQFQSEGKVHTIDFVLDVKP